MRHVYWVIIAVLFQQQLQAGPVETKGDFRYRYEAIEREDRDEKRVRHRMRARIGFYSELDESNEVGIRILSGDDDPRSGNQTLGDNASSKGIRLDLAYFAVKPVDGVVISGGKVKQPFFVAGKSEVIFDSDWNPEGIFVKYTWFNDQLMLVPTLASFWLDERAESREDAILNAGQLVLATKNHSPSLTLALSSYVFENLQGYEHLSTNNSFGNSSTEQTDDETGRTYGVYVTGYRLQNASLEIEHELGRFPVGIFYDQATNLAAANDNKAQLFGVFIGDGTFAGSRWKVKLIRRKVQKDAVVGAITDSDFARGRTDARGDELNIKYATSKVATLALTYFDSVLDLDDEQTYKRLQLDLSYKF